MKDRLIQIFLHQRDLMENLKPKEMAIDPTFSPWTTLPLDLDTYVGQRTMRNFGWFLIEEIAETMESWFSNDDAPGSEVADAFHFLVELAILAGLDPEVDFQKEESDTSYIDRLELLFQMDQPGNSVRLAAMYLVEQVGSALHFLRSKPWTSSPKLSSPHSCQLMLIQSFYRFGAWSISMGIDAQMLYDLYMQKKVVNMQRIENGY